MATRRREAYRHVCGPEWIRTLRGELLGRSVALVLCGEARRQGQVVGDGWVGVLSVHVCTIHVSNVFCYVYIYIICFFLNLCFCTGLSWFGLIGLLVVDVTFGGGVGLIKRHPSAG